MKKTVIMAGAALALGAPFIYAHQTADSTPAEAERTVQETPENDLTAIAYDMTPPEGTDTVPSLYDELDEFVLTAKKETIKSDGAKLTYDMEQDQTSKGQSLLDALRKIPMVSVDGQDNIYIKGSQNFRVYVNGKEDPMLTANAKTVFKAMPAESVSKIEVITEPGAKYDAEGTGGILNLITERKQSKDGYAGSASVSFSSQNSGASLYGRMKYGKVTADANINYANNSVQKQSSTSTQETLYLDRDDNYRQVVDMKQSFTFDYIGAGLNLSWEPSDRDLISFGADVTDVDADVRHLDLTTDMFTRSGALLWSTVQTVRGSMQNLGSSGNISYRRLFDDKGQSFTAAYRFSFSKNPWDLRYSNSVGSGDALIAPAQRNIKDTYQREHTATIDYSNPLADGKHTVEAGAKGIFRRNSALNNSFEGTDAESMQAVPAEDGDTRQVQDVYALYASYTGAFDKISVTAGMRYEHTYMGLDFIGSTHGNFRRHLNDAVPNASVTYMFGPATNLRLAYQMRISRPGISQLDPSTFKLTQNMWRKGNPDLESEKYNSVSLTYTNFGRVLGGNIGISYSQADNTIEEYNVFEDNVITETYGNFGKKRRAEVSGFLNWNITGNMSLTVNGSVDYTDIVSGKLGFRNHGWNASYGASFNYSGPWRMKYSLYGGQSTGDITLQGHSDGWYYYGLGISKSFLKDDALTLSVNAGNFLTKYTDYRSVVRTENTRLASVWRNRSWNVGVSLSWNFGHLQDRVKKTDANLENDDTKKPDGKGGGLGI